MTKLEVADLVLELTKKDILGRPVFRPLRGLKIPKSDHMRFFLLSGEQESIKEGIDVQQIKHVLHYLCAFCKLMNETVCPMLGE